MPSFESFQARLLQMEAEHEHAVQARRAFGSDKGRA
jgi:hypothetical protein